MKAVLAGVRRFCSSLPSTFPQLADILNLERHHGGSASDICAVTKRSATLYSFVTKMPQGVPANEVEVISRLCNSFVKLGIGTLCRDNVWESCSMGTCTTKFLPVTRRSDFWEFKPLQTVFACAAATESIFHPAANTSEKKRCCEWLTCNIFSDANIRICDVCFQERSIVAKPNPTTNHSFFLSACSRLLTEKFSRSNEKPNTRTHIVESPRHK